MNSEKSKNSILLITAIVSGFIGGVIGATLNLLISKPNDTLMGLVLNWPFLSFVLIIFIVTIFYDPIKELISKRIWKLKYGDKELSINEYIEKAVDEKLSDSENQTPETTTNPSIIEKIKKIFNIDSDELAKIIYHLGSSNIKWRSLKTLSKRTGLDNDKIERYATSRPELIIRSIGTSGNGIYRLKDEKKLLFEEKINNNP